MPTVNLKVILPGEFILKKVSWPLKLARMKQLVMEMRGDEQKEHVLWAIACWYYAATRRKLDVDPLGDITVLS